jgi:hypothetical protein
MDNLITMFNNLQANLLTLTVPVAVVGFALWGISILLTPVIPEWGQGMRGYFQRAMLVVMFMGGVASIVAGLYALGQSVGG